MRPSGVVKERPSERKRESNRANARKPRGRRPDDEERALLDAFKRDARKVITTDAKARLFKILRETVSDDVFLRAFEMTANRIGLPAMTHQQVDVKQQAREVVVVSGGLGWPGVAGAEVPAAGDDGDHDDRQQSTLQ